jgi:hypothetical protein
MPLARALGSEPLRFGIIALITIEMGVKPLLFGLLLFVMKGVSTGHDNKRNHSKLFAKEPNSGYPSVPSLYLYGIWFP